MKPTIPKYSIAPFLLFILITSFSMAQEKQVTLNNTSFIQLTNELTDRDHELIIFLPGSYNNGSEQHYPVLYFLDAYWDMPLFYSIHGQLVYDNVIPELIMVGFSYPGENANYDKLRSTDMTPTKNVDMNPVSGNGPKFLKFIETVVIPHIDANYRTKKTERALAGSSLLRVMVNMHFLEILSLLFRKNWQSVTIKSFHS